MEIRIDYQDFVFSCTDVEREWFVKESDAQKALGHAGFTNVKRHRVAGQKNPTSMWIHKSLITSDGDWKSIRHRLYKKGFNHNPIGCGQDIEVEKIESWPTPTETVELKTTNPKKENS